jgi:hypothetical protein
VILVVLRAAEADIEEAFRWYEARRAVIDLGASAKSWPAGSQASRGERGEGPTAP